MKHSLHALTSHQWRREHANHRVSGKPRRDSLKARPGFPERAGSLQDARAYAAVFFAWYNHHHRHSGIGLLMLADMHFGHAEERRDQRAAVLRAAYEATPERFVRQLPLPPALPAAAWINPPKLLAHSEDVAQ